MMIVCCSCKRVKQDEEWVDCFDLENSDGALSHGYCPDCFRRAMQAMKAQGRSWETLKVHGFDHWI